jgi:hypothetical protein
MNFSSHKLINNALLYAWAVKNVPMLALLRPSIQELNVQKCIVKIPSQTLTRNHWNSMYISALISGADLACGLLGFYLSKKMHKKVSIVFKDIRAHFLKRSMGDIYFECLEGKEIEELISEAAAENKRKHKTLKIRAYNLEGETTAEFELTLSVKSA